MSAKAKSHTGLLLILLAVISSAFFVVGVVLWRGNEDLRLENERLGVELAQKSKPRTKDAPFDFERNRPPAQDTAGEPTSRPETVPPAESRSEADGVIDTRVFEAAVERLLAEAPLLPSTAIRDRIGSLAELRPIVERKLLDPDCTRGALMVLGTIDGLSLEDFLGSVRNVQEWAAESDVALQWALRQRVPRGDPIVALRRLRDDPSPHVRAAAAAVAGDEQLPIEFDHRVEVLEGLVEDQDRLVAATAIYTWLGSSLLSPHLIELLPRLRSLDPALRRDVIARLLSGDADLDVLVLAELARDESALLEEIESVVVGAGEAGPRVATALLPVLFRFDRRPSARWTRLLQPEFVVDDPPEAAIGELLVAVSTHDSTRPAFDRLIATAAAATPEIAAILGPKTNDRDYEGVVGASVPSWARCAALITLADGDGSTTTPAVCLALARLGDPLGLPCLERHFAGLDDESRLVVADVLARAGMQSGIAYLEGAADGANSAPWNVAVDRLLAARNAKADRALERLLKGAARPVRERILAAMEETPRALSTETIEALLEATDIRGIAAFERYDRLLRICGVAAERCLVERLFEDRLSDAEAAMEVLAPRAVKVMLPFLANRLDDPDPKVRAASLAAIRFQDCRSIATKLVERTKDADALVRLRLAECLAAIPSESIAGALVVLSKDADWLVREAATSALSRQESPAVVPALRQRLADDVDEVRNAARRGLLRKERYDVVPDLCADLDDPWLGRRTRTALIERFGERGAETSAEWLTWWNVQGQNDYTSKK